MSAPQSTIAAPSRLLTALEVRSFGEHVAMAAAMPLLTRLPRGDGHTVLVLPGFGADDQSTQLLRNLLYQLGYDTQRWKLGRNLGPTTQVVDGLRALIETHADDAPISIVGWSMGGIYAREIAREAPEAVRQVITLGSPIRMGPGDRSATSGLWDATTPMHDPTLERELESERELLPVPTTAIYTRTDGIVSWKSCLTPPAPTHENIEVYGSHCGLGANTSVAYVIADRLSQPANQWQPFRAPQWLRGAYPRLGSGAR